MYKFKQALVIVQIVALAQMAMGYTYDSTVEIGGYSYCYTLSPKPVDTNTCASVGRVDPSPSGDFVFPSHILGCPVTSISGSLVDWYEIGLSGAASLTGVVLPETIVSIGEMTFKSDTALTNVTITGQLEGVGRHAFMKCSSLRQIILPESLNHIGYGAFAESGLTNIVLRNPDASLEEGFKQGSRDACGIFADCTNLVSASLPNGMLIIPSRMFWRCNKLDLDIPGSVTEIRREAFYNCSSLQSAKMPAALRVIGIGAFNGCSSLKTVDLPDGLAEMGESAFQGCGLETLAIPSSIEAIPNRAFASCKSLASVNVGDGVKTIGIGAFSGCTNLISVLLPTSITQLGSSVFWGCSAMEEVELPDTIDAIPSSAFYNCTSLNVFPVKNGVTRIGDNAFALCSNLHDIGIPASVKHIGAYSFSVVGGSAPTTVTLHEGLETIGAYAFSSATGVREMRVPESVTNLAANAFDGWSNRQTVFLPAKFSNLKMSGNAKIRYYGSVVIQDEQAPPIPCEWLDENYPNSSTNYPSVAASTAANGVNKVWECYVAGISPTNATQVFRTVISWDNGEPKISWEPKLAADEESKRVYTEIGKTNLTDKGWTEVSPANRDGMRFFKVKVEMRQ